MIASEAAAQNIQDNTESASEEAAQNIQENINNYLWGSHWKCSG